MLLCFNSHFKVAGGFKKNPEDDEGEICGDVEVLDLEKNVWKSAPSLTVPRSALKALRINNFYG